MGERPATVEEQRALAAWSGWGGLSPIFDSSRDDWAPEQARLADVLTGEQIDAAAQGVLNAHYTNPSYIEHIWKAMGRLGVYGGRFLEPGCGSGNFIGRAPAEVDMVGIELDPTTAAIASKLYPSAEIRGESFAHTTLGASYFDGAIGNVPFSDIKLHDPAYNAGHHSIHNHFILKSLAMTRPGGLVTVISSHWTLDAKNPAARRDIQQVADLVGVVRLPTGAHREAADTDALTDVLIFRKRLPNEEPAPFDWEHTRTQQFEEGQASVNEYFTHHPERVLGQMQVGHGMYNAQNLNVISDDLTAVGPELGAALTGLTDEAIARGLVVTDAPAEALSPIRVERPNRANGHIDALDDGTFTVLRHDGPQPLKVPTAQRAELRGLCEIRDATRDLIALEQASNEDSPQLVAARTYAKDTYEAFTSTFGGLNREVEYEARVKDDNGEWTKELRYKDRPVVRLFREDPYSAMTMAVEVWDQADGVSTPAPLLSARQIGARYIPQGADTITDAVAISREQRGHLDVDYMAHLLDDTPEAVRSSLTGLAFEDPENPDTWVPRAEYVSGDVRAKLGAARAVAETDPARWAANVEALEANQPEPITLDQVEISPGAPWIPQDVTKAFFLEQIVDHKSWASRGQPVCFADPRTWSWTVQLNGATTSRHAHQRWNAEVARRQPYKLWEAVLNNRQVVISDKQSDGTEVVDTVATEAAHAVMDEMREAYSEYMWADPVRVRELTDRYNAMFNTVVPRDYTEDGKALNFPGLASSVHPYEHQPAAVARMIAEPSVGLFHEVGAGKTKSMIMGAMEMKRLGIINKPVVVVPNHMLLQFSNEWLQTYPGARVLVATEGSSAGERRQLVAKATMSDWDGIVMTQENFKALAVTDETQADYIYHEIEQYRQTIELSEENNVSVSQLQKAVAKMEQKLQSMVDHPTDAGLTFEAMGIDYIIADEAHAYKNLGVSTNLQGVGPSQSSARAADMMMKMNYLRGRHDHVGTFATATPIANTISEAHTMMRYLRPDLLEERGILAFDAFAATFCQATMKAELNVVGDYRMRTRIARFQNLPEFLAVWGIPADVKTAEDLNLNVPLIQPDAGGVRQARAIAIAAGSDIDAWNRDIAARNEAIASGIVDPHDDNMLRLSTHGRLAALDLRLVGRSPSQETKVERAGDEIYRIWQATKDNVYHDAAGNESTKRGGLQIVFCDMSTPKSDGEWDAYHGLKDALVERGMDPTGVRFMHEASTDAKKEDMFRKARSGEISVLIGSTAKMGVGTNIQARAVAMHHLDAPWRPADVAQRDGRIIRAGNQNTQVEILRYVTERSFDSYMWQTLERKQGFISQVISNHVDSRTVEDIGDTTMSFAQVKAIATGDPDILERTEVEADKRRYSRLLTAHNRKIHQLGADASLANMQADHAQRRIDALTPIVDGLTSTAGDDFTVSIGATRSFEGQTFTDRKAASAHFAAVFHTEYEPAISSSERLPLGGDVHLYASPRSMITLGGVHLRVSELFRPEKRSDGLMVGFQIDELAQARQHADPLRIPLRSVLDGEPGVMIRLSNAVSAIATRRDSAEASLPLLRERAREAEEAAREPFAHAEELADATAKLEEIDARIARRSVERTLTSGVRFTEHADFYSGFAGWPRWNETEQVAAPLRAGETYEDLDYSARYANDEGQWSVWAVGHEGKAVGLIQQSGEPDRWGVFDLKDLETLTDPLSQASGLEPRASVHRLDAPTVAAPQTGTEQTDDVLEDGRTLLETPEVLVGAKRLGATSIDFTNSFDHTPASLTVAVYSDGNIVTAISKELNHWVSAEHRNHAAMTVDAVCYLDRQGTDGRQWLDGNGRYVRALLGQDAFPDDVAYCDRVDPQWRQSNVTVTQTEIRPVRGPDGEMRLEQVRIMDPDQEAQRRPTSERDMPETTPSQQQFTDFIRQLGAPRLDGNQLKSAGNNHPSDPNASRRPQWGQGPSR